MPHPALIAPAVVIARPHPVAALAAAPAFRFESLMMTEHRSLARGRSITALGSVLAHAALLIAVVLIPLLSDDVPPASDRGFRAFFVSPVETALPPPPPPPPPAAAGAHLRAKAPAVVRTPPSARFTAPVEVPDRVEPDAAPDFGVEGGVPGGVEGGVPGGVVGGIVGGLPPDAPPAPAPAAAVVRIGGKITPPRQVHSVPPVYPELAVAAGIGGVVVVDDAYVDGNGRVKSARMISGNPIFEQAALDAVDQWRYQPLLLNGVPTEFLLAVTVSFKFEPAR